MQRLKYLRVVLVLVGIACLCIWPLTLFWPSGWVWHNGERSYYLEMIIAIYGTLGVFLIIASRDPLAHRSLILFTIWSSILHGAVMTIQAFESHHHLGHLWGDIPALFIMAFTLMWLLPSSTSTLN